VYPNPVIGDWLLVPDSYRDSNWTKDTVHGTQDTVLFYNLEGQLILTASIVDGKINVSELQSGFYTLKTKDGYAKIIKQ
jgi:hypothetical protein